MRDVARKLKISHQAPYRHFESRDHLLAEIMRRCFADFAEHLDKRGDLPDLEQDLRAMGCEYLAYAAAKPLEYRLMFGTPWPEPARHPELVKFAVHAFNILRHTLRRKHGDVPKNHARADIDAMFIWSTLHGMASITQANVMDHLALAPEVLSNFEPYVMEKIGHALAAPVKLIDAIAKKK
jgi:AcrR family transcriptional regulator